MIPFGLIFIAMAVAGAVYSYRNATSEDRYSLFDIVDSEEESDPLNQKYGRMTDDKPGNSAGFCPYCGKPVEGEFDFCPKCGKKLPD